MDAHSSREEAKNQSDTDEEWDCLSSDDEVYAKNRITPVLLQICRELGVQLAAKATTEEDAKTKEDHYVMCELDKRLILKVDPTKDNDRANQVRSYRNKMFNPKHPWLDVIHQAQEKAKKGATLEQLEQEAKAQRIAEVKEKKQKKRERQEKAKEEKEKQRKEEREVAEAEEKKDDAKLTVQRLAPNRDWKRPPIKTMEPLVIKNEDGGMEVCEVFPEKIPAIKINDGGNVLRSEMCCVNASLAIYINLLADKTDTSLKLFEQLAQLSFEPATALLNCLLEGRGVSVNAEHLRYECAKHHELNRDFFTALKYFGLGEVALHEQRCPKCKTIVVKKREGCLSYPDFLSLQDQSKFEAKPGICPNKECRFEGPMSMDIDLPDAGFSVLLELLGENGSEKTLYKVDELFTELAVDLKVGKKGTFKCVAIVANYNIKEGETFIKHAVALYSTPLGFMESCDSAPFVRKTPLKAAGDEHRLWRPQALIYCGNVRAKKT